MQIFKIIEDKLRLDTNMMAIRCMIMLSIENKACHIETKLFNLNNLNPKVIDYHLYPFAMCHLIMHLIFQKYKNYAVAPTDCVQINKISFRLEVIEEIRDLFNLFSRILIRGTMLSIIISPSSYSRSKVGFDLHLREVSDEEVIKHFLLYDEICDLIIFNKFNIVKVISLRKDVFNQIEIIERLDLRTNFP